MVRDYFFNESDQSYQLVFNLFGANRARLHAYLSLDEKRLHVVAKRELEKETQRNLWVFQLPKDADTKNIKVDQKNEVYLLEIPKKSPWAKMLALLPKLQASRKLELRSVPEQAS